MLEICWKSVQTLISLPVRGYRPHPNRDEFGCETLDESIREFITSPLTVGCPFALHVRLRSPVVSYYITLSFVRLRSSQLVTSFVRLHSSTTFACETLQFDHFVCETSQFVCVTSQNELMKSHNEHIPWNELGSLTWANWKVLQTNC